MLWLAKIDVSNANGEASRLYSTSENDPYPLSIRLNFTQQTKAPVAFDLQIEGKSSNGGHILQFAVLSPHLASIDVLAVSKHNRVNIEAPYSGELPLIGSDFALTLCPVALGDQANVVGSTVIQPASISLNIFQDACVFWFDDFKPAAEQRLSDDCKVLFDLNGWLAGVKFEGKASQVIRQR